MPSVPCQHPPTAELHKSCPPPRCPALAPHLHRVNPWLTPPVRQAPLLAKSRHIQSPSLDQPQAPPPPPPSPRAPPQVRRQPGRRGPPGHGQRAADAPGPRGGGAVHVLCRPGGRLHPGARLRLLPPHQACRRCHVASRTTTTPPPCLQLLTLACRLERVPAHSPAPAMLWPCPAPQGEPIDADLGMKLRQLAKEGELPVGGSRPGSASPRCACRRRRRPCGPGGSCMLAAPHDGAPPAIVKHLLHGQVHAGDWALTPCARPADRACRAGRGAGQGGRADGRPNRDGPLPGCPAPSLLGGAGER